MRLESTGRAVVYVSKRALGSETVLQSTVLSGFDYADGEELRVRFDVTGDDVVELQGKVWRAGDTEPVAATVSATDSAGTLAAGGLGLRMYAGGGMVSLPLNVTIADYRAIVPGTSPTENRSPVAEFSSVASGLSVVFDGSGSSDADGDALSYAWAFGDGGLFGGRLLVTRMPWRGRTRCR